MITNHYRVASEPGCRSDRPLLPATSCRWLWCPSWRQSLPLVIQPEQRLPGEYERWHNDTQYNSPSQSWCNLSETFEHVQNVMTGLTLHDVVWRQCRWGQSQDIASSKSYSVRPTFNIQIVCLHLAAGAWCVCVWAYVWPPVLGVCVYVCVWAYVWPPVLGVCVCVWAYVWPPVLALGAGRDLHVLVVALDQQSSQDVQLLDPQRLHLLLTFILR